jgi:hypothetical protein
VLGSSLSFLPTSGFKFLEKFQNQGANGFPQRTIKEPAIRVGSLTSSFIFQNCVNQGQDQGCPVLSFRYPFGSNFHLNQIKLIELLVCF